MKRSYHSVIGRLFKLDLLRRIHLQKAATESGLYFGQFPILQYIGEHPGCTQREIADTLGVTSASIALSTKRMQKAGLLIKDIDSNDLRRNQLVLTETGVEYTRVCQDKFEEIDEKCFDNFSDEELARFTQLLDKVLANLADSTVISDRFALIRLANQLESQRKNNKEEDL